MSWLSDLGGAATGAIGSAWDSIRGNPDDIKAAYDAAMGQSSANSEKLKQFLMQQQAKAQGFYAPLQGMFNRAYGQGNIAGPQTPQVPGSSPLTTMYNRSR